MKIVYLKIKDPIAWKQPDHKLYGDDEVGMKALVPNVGRVAGLLIHEDDNVIVIGEHNLAEDNPELDEWGVKFPYYRYVEIICKENIIDRQDFEVREQ